MDAAVLLITAVLVVAGWVALKIRESRRSKKDPVALPMGEREDPTEGC